MEAKPSVESKAPLDSVASPTHAKIALLHIVQTASKTGLSLAGEPAGSF